MSDIAIKVENLSKQYHIGQLHKRHDTLRDALMAGLGRFRRNPQLQTQNKDDTIWALKDVSFEVKRGEVVGIIGRNGAGKSTLLKILTRITEPTQGRAELHGRVGSLLEVGTGFHPELTGRENIYMSGAMLGMRRKEIDRTFDEIVDFSGVEHFIDTPIKRYSSGMNVRLGFAVAAHLEPEIMLVDEVLAVGDAEFQKKCLGKMGDVAKEGRTVIFVSHNMGAVIALCSDTVHLANGKVVDMGSTRHIVANYLSQVNRHTATELDDLRSPGFGTAIRYSEIRLLSSNNAKVRYGEPLVYELQIVSTIAADNLSIGYSIFNAAGSIVGSLITNNQFSVAAGQIMKLELTIPNLCLSPGIYYAGYSIGQGGFDRERQDYDIVTGTMLSFQILPPLQGNITLDGWRPGWGDIIFQDNQLKIIRNKVEQAVGEMSD
jgi:lipopolysaccharide transport system ATP-binding protein